MKLKIFMIKEFLSWILIILVCLDSALKKDDNYCPQVFLKECKYIKKKVIRFLTQDIDIFSSDSDRE